MNDSIVKFLFPAFNSVQRFLVNLICEYYEERADNKLRELAEVNKQKSMLDKQNKKMKSQILTLREENKHLANEIRSAKTMIRILSKNGVENENDCPKVIDIQKIDRLLRKKIQMVRKNEEYQENHSMESFTQFKNRVANTIIKDDNRADNKVLIVKRRRTRNFKNSLKVIQEQSEENSTIDNHLEDGIGVNVTSMPKRHYTTRRVTTEKQELSQKNNDEATRNKRAAGDKSLLKSKNHQKEALKSIQEKGNVFKTSRR